MSDYVFIVIPTFYSKMVEIMKTSQEQIDSFVESFNKILPTGLANQQQVAAYLGCSTAKLERDRWAGTGIPYIKVGRLVRYRKSDVLAYVNGRLRTSTSQGA